MLLVREGIHGYEAVGKCEVGVEITFLAAVHELLHKYISCSGQQEVEVVCIIGNMPL